MTEFFIGLRELNIWSLSLRLVLAILLGGMIGMERGRKRHPAGFRTYLLVCMGAALTMMLGQYFVYSSVSNGSTDMSRMGAQVISGIGFLGAGTIVVTGRNQVTGLTTAAGLWASACMGLAIGAGFYECVPIAFILIFLSISVLPRVEMAIVENTKNLNLYVEFSSMDDIGAVISRIKSQDIQILDVEIDRGSDELMRRPGATFVLRLRSKRSHADVLASISVLDCVHFIDEL